MPVVQKEEKKFISSSLMEGFVSIRSVIEGNINKTNDRKINTIFYDTAKKVSKKKELSFLKAKSYELGYEMVEVDSDYISSRTIGNSHGGIIADCGERILPNIENDNIIPNGFYVMLEGIEDPYNFGYSLRSIYAAGADGILLSERNWMSAAGVVARASAGASELAKIYVVNPEEAIKKFKEQGYKVYATDKAEESISVYDANLKKPLLLLVGGEKRGLSKPVLDLSDGILCLDYGREFRAALSAASAASIISFEIFRQNREKNGQ